MVNMVRNLAIALVLVPSFSLAQSIADGDVIEDAPVNDAPIAQLSARLAYNSSFGPLVGLGIATDRLFGQDQSLRLNFEAQKDARRFTFSYDNDALFGSSPHVGLGVFLGETQGNEVYGFSSRVGRIEPRLSWKVSQNLEASAFLSFSREEIEGVSPTTSILIQNDEGSQNSRAVGVEVGYNLPVTDGASLRNARVSFGASFGETSRDHRYFEVTARAAAIFVANDGNLVIRGTVSAGAINTIAGVSNIGDRYMLGQGSIRGFAFGGFGPRDLEVADTPALGGNFYGSGRIDIMFPNAFAEHAPSVTPGVFLDVGSLWGLDDVDGGLLGADPVDDAAYMRASIGASLRIQTAIGPIEIYVARPIQQQTYDVSETFGLAFTQSF